MGTLFIVSTPIGNLEDITIRAIKTLFSVDIIACEDTRRTGLLLNELKKRYGSLYSSSEESSTSREVHAESSRLRSNNKSEPRLLSYYDQIEQSKTPELIELLEQGKEVALVSDAGTPLVSDPGYKLVREAIRRGITVVSIPGPTAAIAALTASGLPTDKFLFLGYPPEKSSHRIRLFESLSEVFKRPRLVEARRGLDKSPTFIFYCAPHKLVQTLEDMKQTLGDIDIVIARELTKVHEEVWRGSISEAIVEFQLPKGEIVLLFCL
ncbi:MAG: 16S rRNA (cytidine(1402)-2'-O)-methyltransferase [Patescibacteria group bacterium]